MSEKTEKEIEDFLHSVKLANSELTESGLEYVENLRKEDPILDFYISALEFELKELIK